MSLVLDLEAGRRTPLRLLLLFGVLALILLWLTPLPPALLFWFGALGSMVLALFQLCVAALYRRLLPACQARMTRDTRAARGLTAYLRRRLALAYGTLGDDTRLVALLAGFNVAAGAVILFDALLIPTFLWAPLAVFAFASALFALCIAAVSSRIIWDMFGLLLRTA